MLDVEAPEGVCSWGGAFSCCVSIAAGSYFAYWANGDCEWNSAGDGDGDGDGDDDGIVVDDIDDSFEVPIATAEVIIYRYGT